ncbi:LPXTG cell wall anchor domain-containing protein [Kitasatospora sp. KL5]|uniref:LPXTG cell wall anchor domain-containing protein n=1 Tax=Kitasatospora sp. KL5 TaxID=3425125 RepID=UPI003D6F6637
MRAPAISRFVRNAAVTTAAALTIGVGLPVLSGGTAAWAACGAATTAPAAPATELAETGPSAPTAFLFASGAAALALGGGVLFAARKLARR